MKTIKLTTDKARELYEKHPDLRSNILHEFTDEELGIKPPKLTWEDLKEIEGVFIDGGSNITYFYEYSTSIGHRNIIPCKEDAERILAQIQLLQLAKYYNKCEQHEVWNEYYNAFYHLTAEKIYAAKHTHVSEGIIKFKSKSDLEKCIEDNKELWEKYLGV
jgi:hypothetical protein